MTGGVDHEVVVIGAGPSGLAVAGALNRAGVDVLLLERRRVPGTGSRAIGVHPAALAALAPSGVADAVLAEAARITRGVGTLAGRTIGEIRFDRAGMPYPCIASVPQAVTEAALREAAPEPHRGVRVEAIALEPDRAVLRVEGAEAEHEQGGQSAGGPSCAASGRSREAQQRSLTAGLVVLAGGASGRGLLPATAGVRARALPDRYLMTDIPSVPGQANDTAIIALGADGVLESFPLGRAGRRLVAHVGVGAERSPRSDAERLARAVEARLGDAELAERIVEATSFGIRRILLRRLLFPGPAASGAAHATPRLIAIGDTAHEISPIGGQGMNLGLLDAATLAPAIVALLRGSRSSAELLGWERDRLASARTAARLAGLNTRIGRPAAAGIQRIAAAAFAPVSGAVAPLLSRAYTMGFDRAS